MINIHEFSTGIDYKKTSDGGWISEGLTGQYMNKTLDPIPHVIEKAILNKEFAITEALVTDIPTLIGREINQNEEKWSVLMVIIRASDRLGHHFPAYRYFYTRGKGKLEYLLHWWIDEKYPVFNPLEPAFVKSYETEENTEIILDDFQDLLEGTAPIIIPTDKPLTHLIIHAMAKKIAGKNNIAWAWNVGALEYPRSFQAIYPDSVEATELISQVVTSQSTQESFITEYDIKIALQNLMNREEVKLEYLETLETALSEAKIDDKLWQSIFDARGVSVAISEEIYTVEMVRLLTLCAIIIPNTLPIFLVWLQASRKQKDSSEIFLSFQHEIIKKIGGKAPTFEEIIKNISKKKPRLAHKIIEGVKVLIFHLLSYPELLESTIWLLTSSKGIWASFYHHEVKKQIAHDLSLMSEFAQSIKGENSFEVPEWEPIWQQIKVFWFGRRVNKMSQYLPLAKLFNQLVDSSFSAVFYQIATGSVPHVIFKQVTNRSRYSILYGLKVEKSLSELELIGLSLFKILRNIFSILLNILTFLVLITLVLIGLYIFVINFSVFIILCIIIAILKDY